MSDCWVQLFPWLEEQGFQKILNSLSCSASRYPVGSFAAPEIIMSSSQAAFLHITVLSALAALIGGTRAISFISGSKEESKVLP